MIVCLFIFCAMTIFAIGFTAGVRIGEQNVEQERHQAFLEGRRAERLDQIREPLA